MRNLSIYLLILLSGILYACNSFQDEEVATMDAIEQSTKSIANHEPDVGYGIEEYNNLLNSFEPSPVPSGASLIYPAYYGGAYVKDKQLRILISGNPDLYREEFVRRCGSENIVLEKCEYSYVTLLKQISIYDEISIQDPSYNIAGYGIREDLNRIEVKLRDFNDKPIRNLQNTISDSKMVFFTKGEDISIEQGISLNSGAAVRNARGANSTAGFRVMYNGKKCITVAGHTVYKNEYIYTGSNYLGTCLESNFGNRVDAAIVEISLLYSPANTIECTGQSLSTSTRTIPIGGSVNLCGQASGHHSGTVTIAGYTGTVEGQLFTDIVQVQYAQSTTGGDSGSPVYSYSYPYYYTVGTHIGSNSNYAYYTKFNNIQNLYGVTRY